MTHICVSNLTIIGSDNGLSPGRRQAIIWTNIGILLIGSLGTNFNEIVIAIQTFSFKKMHLKMSSAKWRPFCLSLNVLTFRNTGPCITNVFATRRKNFSQWHRSFQRKLLFHWLKFLRRVAITLVIQGPGPLWMQSSHDWWLPLTMSQ